jgi:hypothetical protein
MSSHHSTFERDLNRQKSNEKKQVKEKYYTRVYVMGATG